MDGAGLAFVFLALVLAARLVGFLLQVLVLAVERATLTNFSCNCAAFL
jgi:hypothetical protein